MDDPRPSSQPYTRRVSSYKAALTRVLTSQGGRFVQTSAPPGVINLGLGQPSPRLLPLAEISRAAREQLRPEADPLVLQYGALRGYEDFRRSLARYLSAEYGQAVRTEELMVTAGTSSALTLVAESFAKPGATVIAEDPTYFLAHGVFASAGLEVRGVPVDEQGLEVEALAELLAEGPSPAFVYVIPAFQNPTGVSLARARARRLVELAEAHDFVIVADEPYVALHYTDARPNAHWGSLTQYDEGRSRVLSLGSFSKLLAPGLRLGWAHGAPALIERLAAHGALRSGGCLNPVVANIVHHTLDSGFLARHVDELRAVYGARVRAMAAALREHLPEARFVEPEGGYFCWVDLGEGSDSDALLERAETLRFIPGRRCAVSRDLGRFVRLSFAFYEADEIVEGVARLGASCRREG
jgi:2-aminoadipate transaminase